jgi:hypothetical protein
MKKWILAIAAVATVSAPCIGCLAIPYDNPKLSTRPPEMRLAEQRAFIFREKDKQHLVLSIQYDGATDQFAWIIPVESKPKVDVLAGAPFTELRKMTKVERPVLAATRSAPGGAAPPEASVQVLERKEAGPYDLAVLRATDAGGLYEWLRTNSFNISKNARGALDSYVQRDYVFVAARIRPGSQGNSTVAQRLRGGTIAPLHMIYKCPKLSYPLKVTSGNPGMSHMELYVLNPTTSEFGALSPQTFELAPRGATGFTLTSDLPLANPQGDFPTIRKLIPKGGKLVKLEGDLSDADRQKDLVFD